MRILVTGGCGFIGANFLNLSVEKRVGDQFLNVDALTYSANPQSLRAIEACANYAFERVDLADARATEAVVLEFRPQLVVHFAAESHVDRSILGPRAFLRANVDGTLNLLEACRKLGSDLELFHHVSTDEVYGSLGETGHFTESTPYDPSSPYSASKAASDHLVRAWGRTYGLPTKISNCSNNYGPYQFPEKLIPLMILNASAGKPLPVYGQGTNVRDWLYVTDHCEAIWAIIERGAVGQTYNVGGNNEQTNIDVVRHICELVAARKGQPVEEVLRLITFVTDRPGHDQRYAIDASKIRRECGWEPRETFVSGFQKTVDWYFDNPDWVHSVQTGAYKQWLDRNYAHREGATEKNSETS
jgi:dTDP-glucose 4,6-dehydratase